MQREFRSWDCGRYAQNISWLRTNVRGTEVGGLEASTRYSAQLLGEYAATLPNPLQDSRDAGLRRVVAFTRSDQNVGGDSRAAGIGGSRKVRKTFLVVAKLHRD